MSIVGSNFDMGSSSASSAVEMTGTGTGPSTCAVVKILEFEEIFIRRGSDLRARSGHRIVCDDSNVYLVGGFSRLRRNTVSGLSVVERLYPEVWQLNMIDENWHFLETKGRMPTELASHSAALYGKSLIVFGGSRLPFGESSNQMHICDVESLRWSHVCTRGVPPQRNYGQACVINNGNFYVVGGTSGHSYSMDIHRLNLKTWTWEELFVTKGNPSEPEPRYRHEICVSSNKIYVFGGGTADSVFDFVNIPTFDIAVKKWNYLITLPDCVRGFPFSRRCHAIAHLKEDVFVFGGYDTSEIFLIIWKLNLEKQEWTALSVRMPMPLFFHSCSVTPAGRMYMFGGVKSLDSASLANVRTNRTFKIWLTVPSLKEMTWDIIQKSSQSKLSKLSRNEMMALGVPIEFADRIRPQYGFDNIDDSSSSTSTTQQTWNPYECINNCIGPQPT